MESKTNPPAESRLSFWLSWGVLLAGAGAGLASAYIVITTYSPVAHWDEWSLFGHLADRWMVAPMAVGAAQRTSHLLH